MGINEMATKRTARHHPVVETLSPKADPWTIHVQSKLVELESVKAAADRKWGENRLCTLVNSEVREKFWLQNIRLHQAMAAKDQAKFDSSVAGMIRAYAALDQLATDDGCEPADTGIPRIEWEMQNGQTMVIVRTVNEAVAIQTQRQDLANHHIWSMQEMEVLLADPRMQEVIKIKALVPTAQLTSFKPTSEFKPGGATGFDDFENDLTFSDNDTMDYKFDSKQAERFRDGSI
jgi:glycine cleavage system H lipoate-binding protein